MSERDERLEVIVRQIVAEAKAARDAADEEVAIVAGCARLRATVDAPERVSEASVLREALEEIARLGCEDWPGGNVLTCSCNSCIAQRALVSEPDPVSRAPVDPPEIEDVLHRAGYVTADVPIPETSDSTRCRECGRKTETVSGVCIRCAVKCAPFVDPPERESELREPGKGEGAP